MDRIGMDHLVGARRLNRRTLIQLAGLGGVALAAGAPARSGFARLQTEPVASLTVDLTTEPATLDPATSYHPNSWSVVHSIYDSLVQYGPDGELQLVLAESLALIDPLTYEITLRQGVTFHNGEPFDAKSVTASVAHILDENVASQVAGNFQVIQQVQEIDPYTVRLILTQPAPWLPAQIAAWLVMLPPTYATAAGTDLNTQPIGTGPYRFVSWEPGAAITLEANPDYFAASPKGPAIAQQVIYRTVPEASTRVADLLAGTSDLVGGVPFDQIDAVTNGGAEIIAQPVSGSAWIRIATDAAPFSDPRVRQALNYAVDVDAIIQALLGGNGQRLAGFFSEGGLGYDPSLAPYTFDPERAKSLLAEAGFPDGFETDLEYASTEREELPLAVAGQLDAVGIRVTTRPTELATFNATWKDAEAPPLRLSTWRPVFDPYTLLSLVVSNQGFLSRYDSPDVQALIDAGASETDPELRATLYRDLGKALYDDPAAIYLFSLTSVYGLGANAAGWTPRADDYVILTRPPSS